VGSPTAGGAPTVGWVRVDLQDLRMGWVKGEG